MDMPFSVLIDRSLSKDWSSTEAKVIVVETVTPISPPVPIYSEFSTYYIPLEDAYKDVCDQIKKGKYSATVGYPNDADHCWQALYVECYKPDSSYHQGVIVVHYEPVNLEFMRGYFDENP